MKKLTLTIMTLVLTIPTALMAGERFSTYKSSAIEDSKKTTEERARVLLREAVKVKNKTVRLGDIFTGTGSKADIAIAYAPEPGKRAIFDARWLLRVARTYRLDWRPMGIEDQVMVERDSTVIPREEIEDSILSALIENGADKSMVLELSNRMIRLFVPTSSIAKVGVEDTFYEPRTGRFTAIIMAPANDPRAIRHRITGRLHKMTEVPVLARKILGKEVISKRDIKWIRIRSDRLRRDTILNANELIGMAAKRGLRSDRPLHTSVVQRPVLVSKGSLVTVSLDAPKMNLTTRGKALQNGSDGDTVRIVNLRSNKIIEAEVTGTGRVSVLSIGMTAIN
jgi:flagella basal body P-ring formation protein FlgA